MAAAKALFLAAGVLDPEKDVEHLRLALADNELENIVALLFWTARDFLEMSDITQDDILETRLKR